MLNLRCPWSINISLVVCLELADTGTLSTVFPRQVREMTLLGRMKALEARKDIQATIISFHQLEILPPSDPARLAGLNATINTITTALPSIPTSDSEWCSYVFHLSRFLLLRWQTIGNLTDLDKALLLSENAIDHAAHFHGVESSNHALYNGMRCVLLTAQYEYSSDKEHLQSAVEHGSIGAAGLPSNHSGRLSVLVGLAVALQQSYGLSGSLYELKLAIAHAEEAYTLLDNLSSRSNTTQTFHVALALGCLHAAHFQRERAILSLDLAVGYFETIIDTAPYPVAPAFYELGSVLASSYSVLSDLELLDRGIVLIRKGLEISPSATRSQVLSQLGYAHLQRYMACMQEKDRELGLNCFNEALASSSIPHQSKVAIEQGRTILMNYASSEDDKSHSRNFDNTLLFQTSDMSIDQLDAAIDIQLKTMRDESIPVAKRVLAGENAVTLDWNRAEAILQNKSATPEEVAAGKYNDVLDSAKVLCNEVVDLVSELAPYLLASQDQQYALGRLNALPAMAVATQLSGTWQPVQAWDLLERSSYVAAGNIMDVRRSLSILDRVNPVLSSRYRALTRKFADFTRQEQGSSLSKVASFNYLQAVNDLKECAQQIRTVAGLSEFLLPPRKYEYVEDHLETVVLDGPIVAVNVHTSFCTALVITKEKFFQVSLRKLSLRDVVTNVNLILGNSKDRICRGPLRTKAKRNARLREILRWLWESVVKPIFASLGYNQLCSPESPKPHLWWHASGLASLLPLHAAGCYEGQSTEFAMNYAQCSYTPTIKALRYASIRPALPQPLQKPDFVVVGMPETPDGKSAPLPNALREMGNVRDSVGFRTHVKELLTPSRAEVISSLENARFIHLACHGVSNTLDPSKSHLKLYNSVEGRVEALTVQDLNDADRISEHAKLAYLSACSTTKSSRTELSFESIHIVSAFQLLGFSQVIGTMWQVTHDAAEVVAAEFYKALVAEQTRPLAFKVGQGRATRALYSAVRKLQEEDFEDVLSWVPFVHFGAY